MWICPVDLGILWVFKPLTWKDQYMYVDFGFNTNWWLICYIMYIHLFEFCLYLIVWISDICWSLSDGSKRFSNVNMVIIFRRIFYPLPLFGLIQQMTHWWYFSHFFQKTCFDLSCKLSPTETIYMKLQNLFFGKKIRKIFQNVVYRKVYPQCWALKRFPCLEQQNIHPVTHEFEVCPLLQIGDSVKYQPWSCWAQICPAFAKSVDPYHLAEEAAGLGGYVGCTSDCRPGDCGFSPCWAGNILSWRLIMKYFLRSVSPFCWFKKSSCQFLAKECA